MAIQLQDRTLEILSMEKAGDGGFHFYGYDVENRHYYQFRWNDEKGGQVVCDHGNQFPNHGFFAAVIGKFNPCTWMTSKVYRLERGWDEKDIQKCWEHFKTLWGGRESPWKE